jgi:hypothetical protein
MGGKIGLRCKGKTLLDKKFVDRAQQCFAEKNKNRTFKCSQLLEGNEIQSRLPFKIFSTLKRNAKFQFLPEKHRLELT